METFFDLYRLSLAEGIIGGLGKNEKTNEKKYYILGSIYCNV